MKESIGSTLLMQIFFVFFVIIISFMAVAINYAKVFHIKNDIITIIEKDQKYNQEQIDNYLKEKNYSNESDKIKIEKYTYKDGSFYYTIVVYSTFNIPLINQSIKIPVRGNTETIVETKEGIDEVNYKEEDSKL